jgi:8-oxo-dGTP pyrophosphatase MutT (NUDIX family)/phosphohistidine phosphatase SixA
MANPPDIVAAGAVVVRNGDEVLLVHRPKYDDWSFPKGKLDRGEHPTAAAVREVAEETGLAARLGRPLRDQHYPVASRGKTVHYWLARPTDGDDVSGYAPNHEIDQVVWASREKAERMLSYKHDQRTLREAFADRGARRTSTLVVLRHAKASSRARWRADDRFRPLLRVGSLQADRLVPVLAAYDVTRLVSSSSVRCVATLVPYADTIGRHVQSDDLLSEEDATREGVTDLVAGLLADRERTVLCTHRPVLPAVFDALGVPATQLDCGEMVVVHHRKGRVLGLETHRAR